jgi:hypothetical protein
MGPGGDVLCISHHGNTLCSVTIQEGGIRKALITADPADA